MQLVLNTYGLNLGQRNRCFEIESKTGTRIISPHRISSILITKAVNITSSAILLAAEFNIPIILLDKTGQPVVKIHPALSAGLTGLRKSQLLFSGLPASVCLVKEMLTGKTQGQLSNLAWWANRRPGLERECLDAKMQLVNAIKKLEEVFNNNSSSTSNEAYLRSWEAITARYYWQAVSILANGENWTMKGRTYRPAGDEINAALNYLYGMLYHQVETALACAGLDSQIGIWHRDNYQTPSLAFDAIESLRPKADRLLMELVINKKLEPSYFETDKKYGFLVNKKGKEILISAFNDFLEERVKMYGKVTEFKNHILQLAYFIKGRIETTQNNE